MNRVIFGPLPVRYRSDAHERRTRRVLVSGDPSSIL
jgi:hypothetical protein